MRSRLHTAEQPVRAAFVATGPLPSGRVARNGSSVRRNALRTGATGATGATQQRPATAVVSPPPSTRPPRRPASLDPASSSQPTSSSSAAPSSLSSPPSFPSPSLPPSSPIPAPSAPASTPCISLAGRPALQAALSSHATDTPVVVFFHARWCRVCKTLHHKLPSVAAQFPSIAWYDIDFALPDNKSLCNDLDVRLLPTFRIYWGRADDSRYEDQFTTGPFGAKRLIERLNEFFNRRS